jgi:uncharacterized Zn-finger protein
VDAGAPGRLRSLFLRLQSSLSTRATPCDRRRPPARRRTGSPARRRRSGRTATSRGALAVRACSASLRAARERHLTCAAGADPALGHPLEFIVLNDTSAEFPAVCKYCSLSFYMSHHH